MKSNNRKMLYSLASRDLKSNKLRNICSVFTIILATGIIMIISLYFLQTQRTSIQEAKSRYQAVFMDVDSNTVDKIQGLDNIIFGATRSLGTLNKGEYKLSIRSMNEMLLKLGGYPALEGRLPANDKEVVLTDEYLKRINSKANIGESISLDIGYGKEEFVISGILPMESTADTYSIYVSDDLISARCPECLYSVYFKLDYTDGWNEAGIKMEIEKLADELGLSEGHIVYSSYYFSLIQQKSSQYMMVVLGISIVVAAISSIVIYSIFYISIIEKTKKYGQLRTIGMTKKQIKTLIFREGKILSNIGSLLGSIFSAIVAYLINPEGWSIWITFIVAVLVGILIRCVVLISLYKPAQIASRISPIDATRYFSVTQVKSRKVNKHHKITPFRLAIINYRRSNKKTFLTIISLGFCGVLLMASSSYFNSISPENMAKRNMPEGEIKIELGTYGPQSYTSEQFCELQKTNLLDSTLIDNLSDISGVKSIKSYEGTVCDITLPTGATDVFVVDGFKDEDVEKIKSNLVEGDFDIDEMKTGHEILVSDANEWESLWGWNVKVGDTLTIQNNQGDLIDYKVVGILKDTIDYGAYNTIFLPNSNLGEIETTVPNYIYQLSIDIFENASISDVEKKVRTLFDENDEIQITTLDDVIQSYQDRLEAYRTPVYGLVIFIGVFGIINLLNTLFTNMTTRKKEYGLFQCVGMSNRQLTNMLLKEGMLYSVGALVISLVFGTFSGVLLCNVLTSFSVFGKVDYKFPIVEMCLYFVMVVMIQILFSFIIIRYLKKESLIERIKM